MQKPGISERVRETHKRMKGWLGSDGFRCALVIGAAVVLLTVLFFIAITPERYDLSVGSISHDTIMASKDVIDEVTTAARREAAARYVEPVYHLVEEVTQEVLTDLEMIFAEMSLVRQTGEALLTENGPDYAFMQEDIASAKEKLSGVTLTDSQIRSLMRESESNFINAEQVVTAAVASSLNTVIRDGQVNEAIQTILQIISFRVETDVLLNVVTPVLRKCIRPNMVVEQAATEEARQKARDEVEPVVYGQGQNIIRSGDRVSLNQLEMLRSLGLLVDDNSFDLRTYAGAFLVVLVGIAAMLIPLGMMKHAILKNIRKTCIMMLVLVVSVAFSIAAMKAGSIFLAPMAMSAMLLTSLLGGTVGICGNLCVTIIVSAMSIGTASVYATNMIHMLLSGIIAGMVSARFIRKRPQRVRLLYCGLIAALSNGFVIFSVGLMTSNDTLRVWNDNMVWSMCGGLLSAVLTLALQPLFEASFSLPSQSKLLEITNPNHPLLKRLLLEAAGSYHHSLLVANLAEAASEAIGADPLLTRAGAYFHDVGKLKRPMYFKENQQADNLHDKTDPYVSAAIVTAHTGDGLQLAQKYRIPQEIQRFITEHHGDTMAIYFYHKALKQAEGKPVNSANFRYEGKRPSTKESAVVMLADTVEAATRTLSEPTPRMMEDLVERLMREKIEDGQLSESPLTLRDIDKVSEAFINTLNGMYHKRVEYPAMRVIEEEQAALEQADAEPRSEADGQTDDPAEMVNGEGTVQQDPPLPLSRSNGSPPDDH